MMVPLQDLNEIVLFMAYCAARRRGIGAMEAYEMIYGKPA